MKRLGWFVVVLAGCQRLEVEDTTTGAHHFATSESSSSSDGGGGADASTVAVESSTGDDAMPPASQPCAEFSCVAPRFCVVQQWRCQCWADDTFCEPYDLGPYCADGNECEGLGDEELAACRLEQACGDAGGAVEGEGFVCTDDSATCRGSCDLDPSTCDADHDGVATFACGTELCTRDQYCANHWDGPGPVCLDVPASCAGLPLLEQQSCVGATFCAGDDWLEAKGHALQCHDASDTE